MPALSYLYQRAAAALSTSSASSSTDTRILDARQLLPNRLLARQSGGQVLVIPTQYAGIKSGPAPGAVAGIVLGSVAGFLFLLWLLWFMSQGTGFVRASTYDEEEIIEPSRHRSHSRRREMRSVSPAPPRRDRIIRKERIIRENVPPPMLPREPSRIRETVILDDRRSERRVPGDDIIEVMEEHGGSSIGVPAPRKKSRRSSTYRRDDDFGGL